MEEVTRILQDPSLKLESKALEREALIRTAVSSLFDFPEISRRVLGRHWRSLTEAECKEFVTLFEPCSNIPNLPKIILVEGLSLTANYRAQFDPIIQRASFQELVDRIRQKLAAPGS